MARGIIIPWFIGGVLTLVKVRQPDGCKPKYAEVYRDRSRHLGIYPGPEVIRPGRPLILPEGEFDRWLLAQAIGESGAVATLGCASGRPAPGILGPMLDAAPWYIATDADDAGKRAADAWDAYPRARRIRPPGPHKDWTEAAADGVNLARWWGDIFVGCEAPALFTWEDLAGWRWGPAAVDSSPAMDDYEREERLAIQAEIPI